MRLPRLRAAAAGPRRFSSQGAVASRPRNPSLNVPPRPARETKRKPYARAAYDDAYDDAYGASGEHDAHDEHDSDAFFRPPTTRKPFYGAGRPPPTPVPHAFAASVLTAVMSSPDGTWGGRRRPSGGGWAGAERLAARDGVEPIGVPMPPPPPSGDFGETIGPGVVAPQRPTVPRAPNPLLTLRYGQLQPAMRRMAAVQAAAERAEGKKKKEEEEEKRASIDDDNGGKKAKKKGKAVPAPTKAEARAAAAAAGPPLRVRYARQHVLHPFSMRFLDGTAVSMPLPGTAAAAAAPSPYGPAGFAGFATQYATAAAPSPRARPPTLSLSFPHCLGALTTQRYVAKQRTEPLWIIVLLHHAHTGPLALPSRSPLVQHCMKRRVKRIFVNALRRRGYDGAGRPLDTAAAAAAAATTAAGERTPRPTAPLQGTVSFDGLVSVVLKLPQPQLEAFMDGVVDVLEGLLGDKANAPPQRPARPSVPGGSGGPAGPGSRKPRETNEKVRRKPRTGTYERNKQDYVT